ncbi:MAG: class I SAM-dependent methyltransferase [Gammaproteobacteria bacterium]|nr:class I SAM-dependent methyltransferase [Gammaproteobacteria bacterium]
MAAGEVKAEAGGVTVRIAGRTLRFDDREVQRRAKQGRRGALARACGAQPGVSVHDALAGWGTDGLLLAMLGCRVHMTEAHPDVCAALAARVRASALLPSCAVPTWACGDARECWHERRFDVVYLDPMFGDHPSGALPALRMQALAALADEMGDDELAQMLAAARKSAASRVVVKRRRRAPAVAPPDWRILGRSVRFDVYRGRALP